LSKGGTDQKQAAQHYDWIVDGNDHRMAASFFTYLPQVGGAIKKKVIAFY
jgi:hypothetical protein